MKRESHRKPNPRKPSFALASRQSEREETGARSNVPAGRSDTGLPLYLQRKAEPGAPAVPEQTTAAAGLIVEDDASDLAAGQMIKSQFLSQLHAAICATAEEALAGTVWSVVGCPWIDHWFGHYAGQSAEHIEKALQRYAPAAAGAASAADYIPIAAARVRTAIQEWTSTGEVAEMPEDVSSTPDMLARKDDGGGPTKHGPASVSRRLGSGRPMDSGVRRRMESAFQTDFSGVRVHTDGAASSAASDVHARAFTVGRDVGFARGQYQPDTVMGDALLAHELAHVVQQREAGGRLSGGGEPPGLEHEADTSAIGAVMSLWGDLARNAMPRLRSGLRLQRCKDERQEEIERLAKVQYKFMEDKRKQQEAESGKKVEMGEVVTGDVQKHKFKKNPVDAWTKDLTDEQRENWKKRAAAIWPKVIASVKGTELEKTTDGITYDFDPKKALEKGWYAWQSGKTLGFGMSWVQNAEADVKNAWPNLAHEMGGHFEYGKTYASEIMKIVLDKLPKSERDKLVGTDDAKQEFFETYEYAETEIYSAVRERRYRVPADGSKPPTTGSIHPDKNIAVRLAAIKELYAPEVQKAIIKVLKKKIDESPDILDRDKKYFAEQVKDML